MLIEEIEEKGMKVRQEIWVKFFEGKRTEEKEVGKPERATRQEEDRVMREMEWIVERRDRKKKQHIHCGIQGAGTGIRGGIRRMAEELTLEED